MDGQNAISRVSRSKEEARTYYDRLSGFYDWLSGIEERSLSIKTLNYLNVQGREKVLEIGFGTGYCLQRISMLVGHEGRACVIYISAGMAHKARKRLENLFPLNRVDLFLGDASRLPFESKAFDAVFSSFTIELFDTIEIPQVLGEIMRVLKPGGRLGIISLIKDIP